ncbi:MAG: RNA 2',3'-cyclic phosphodiesterase [Candidatus Latescibacteria bacterium]|nr:RNA 2',3'-cyclic phosphodiesterase [Candidatus Latescibacterota bacterium]
MRAAIRAALDDFPIADPPWRWAAPETWHVTLKFIGEARDAELGSIVSALDALRARHPAFHVTLGKFGAFPDLRAPRVFFYGVEMGREELAALAEDVDRALEQTIGVAREARDFHAHATVARIKEPLPRSMTDAFASVAPLSHPVTRVSSFDLMESRLGRTGARYSTVKRFALP